MATHRPLVFWLVIGVFFLLWTIRALVLPAPSPDSFLGVMVGTILRLLFFLSPIVLAVFLIYRENWREEFALKKPTVLGWIIAGLYCEVIIILEIIQPLTVTMNPWIFINLPVAPIIGELVFRGFVFTQLLKQTGKIQTILISSVLFTLIHFPGWIFVSGLKGEEFTTITGQVFLFSLGLGVIRLIAKSVFPSIVVHIVNNFFAFATH